MKKIFDKLRVKIVHKLGGFFISPLDIEKTVEIQQFERKYAELCASYDIDRQMYNGDVVDFVHKELAYKLANKMLEDGLINFYDVDIQGEPTVQIEAYVRIEDRRVSPIKSSQ